MSKTSIIYYLGHPTHIRTVLPIKKQKHLHQTVIVSANGRSMIKNHLDELFFFHTNKQIRQFIASKKPDILVITCKDKVVAAEAKKKGTKVVYLSHGIYANSERNIRMFTTLKKFFRGLDLICVASDVEKKIIVGQCDISEDKIVTNAVSQFDMLKKIKRARTDRFAILCPGVRCKGRVDYMGFIQDYYNTVYNLSMIAEKYDWKVIVKPKSDEEFRFLKRGKEPWMKDMRDKYARARKSKYMSWINYSKLIYEQFSKADAVVMAGYSTLDIETCMADIPLISIQMHDENKDYNNLNQFNAALIAKNMDELEEHLLKIKASQDNILREGQEALLKSIGIDKECSFADKFQEAMLGLLKE